MHSSALNTFSLAAILLMSGTTHGATSPNDPCGTDQSIAPIGVGLLKLAEIRCITLPRFFAGGALPPKPSPDGNSFFTFEPSEGLWLGSIGGRFPLQQFQVDVALHDTFDSSQPFAWFKDGRSLLGVTQDMMKPLVGSALGPLKPFLASIDGEYRPLPSLESPAGPLDEIHWVGHEGLAVAVFGAKGDYYRPARPNPRPTIALVDAFAGRVIQSVPLSDLVPDASRTGIGSVAWRTGEGGIVEALISLAPDRWIIWRQGEKPRRIPISIKSRGLPFALSPNGRTVLVMRWLSATGATCEGDPNCSAPIPVTGPVAELYDTLSGDVVWTVSATAEEFSDDGAPAISPDGRLALISMPRKDQKSTVALVEMASGKLLQRIPSPGPHRTVVGFSADSRRAWISGRGRLVTYNIER